jgi:hypothetical protein
LTKSIKIRIYKTIILPVVLFGCKTLSLLLRKKNRLSVFENGVVRIFGLKREVTGGWRKLHNEKLPNLYSSPNILDQVKEDAMGRACSMNGGEAECI